MASSSVSLLSVPKVMEIMRLLGFSDAIFGFSVGLCSEKLSLLSNEFAVVSAKVLQPFWRTVKL